MQKSFLLLFIVFASFNSNNALGMPTISMVDKEFKAGVDTNSYIPLLAMNKRWHSRVLKQVFEPDKYKYSVIDSELIEGEKYYIVLFETNGGVSNYPFKSQRFYREDTLNKKVFVMVDVDSLREKLLYDFSLSVGDTFFNYRDTIILKTIQPFPLEKQMSKIFEFQNTKGDTIQWVEGIGSLSRLGNTTEGRQWGMEELICVRDDKKEMIFLKPNYESSCNFEFAMSLPIQQKKSVHVFPNPFNTLIKIELENPYPAIISLTNSLNQEIIHQEIENTFEVEIPKLSYLKSGIYFLKVFQNEKVSTFKLIK